MECTSTNKVMIQPTQDSLFTIFVNFLKLGCMAFGGPIAHLAYFRQAFIVDKKWLTEQQYADLIALCQFLPGPASSQAGMALGYYRGGFLGSIVAWAGFTLPSSLLLLAAAYGFTQYSDDLPNGVVHGLKLAALAVVVQAFWGMAKQLCFDRIRQSIMVGSALILLWISEAWAQFAVIFFAGIIGFIFFKSDAPAVDTTAPQPFAKSKGAFLCALFIGLLFLLPWLATTSAAAQVADIFYRTGSFVFGGGHVVLPLLETEAVGYAQVTEDVFLAGYGLTQAVPGPLFTFSTFLGAFMSPDGQTSWSLAILATVALFLPGFLLVIGFLPFWEHLKRHTHIRSALSGINAAVVGLLLAALYDPIWTSSIKDVKDVGFALVAWLLLSQWKCPPWLLVALSASLYPLIA